MGIAGTEAAAQEKLPIPPVGLSGTGMSLPLPVTVDGGFRVPPPRVISAPDPKIPKDGIKGFVLIMCIVGTDGRVRDPRITQSLSPQNDASALESVKGWKFLSTKRNGKVVAVRTTVAVEF